VETAVLSQPPSNACGARGIHLGFDARGGRGGLDRRDLWYAETHDARSFWVTLSIACIIPFVLWNWTVGLVVYLHHTHPDVQWYAERREWLQVPRRFRRPHTCWFPPPSAPGCITSWSIRRTI
jgi:hypothetical protein